MIYPLAAIVEMRVLVAWFQKNATLSVMVLSLIISTISLVLYRLLPNPILLFLTLYYVWNLGAVAEDVYRDQQNVLTAILVLSALGVGIYTILRLHHSDTLELMLLGTGFGVIWLLMQRAHILSVLLFQKKVSVVLYIFAEVGSISYSLYLTHYPSLYLAKYFLGDNLTTVFCGIVWSVLLAVGVESLGQRIRRLIVGWVTPTSFGPQVAYQLLAKNAVQREVQSGEATETGWRRTGKL